jgi:hypothetical protein
MQADPPGPHNLEVRRDVLDQSRMLADALATLRPCVDPLELTREVIASPASAG